MGREAVWVKNVSEVPVKDQIHHGDTEDTEDTQRTTFYGIREMASMTRATSVSSL